VLGESGDPEHSRPAVDELLRVLEIDQKQLIDESYFELLQIRSSR